MRQETLWQRFEGDPLARLVPPGPMSDAEFPRPQPKEAVDAELVDGGDFVISDVSQRPTEFTHFLDGAQKVWRVLYYGFDPIVIAHLGAGLVERREGDMTQLGESFAERLVAIGPDVSELKAKFEGTEFEYVPAPLDQEWSPMRLGAVIRMKVGDLRSQLECSLVQGVKTGHLMIDGPLSMYDSLLTGRFGVGLVKTHERLYVKDPGRQRAVFGMKAGQRSSVFHRSKRYSWYLRVREERNQAPMFGIMRLETPGEASYLERVDEISGWVLDEMRPLSLPDPRYDVMPYPIRIVEQHLKARQRSDAFVRGRMGV